MPTNKRQRKHGEKSKNKRPVCSMMHRSEWREDEPGQQGVPARDCGRIPIGANKRKVLEKPLNWKLLKRPYQSRHLRQGISLHLKHHWRSNQGILFAALLLDSNVYHLLTFQFKFYEIPTFKDILHGFFHWPPEPSRWFPTWNEELRWGTPMYQAILWAANACNHLPFDDYINGWDTLFNGISYPIR